MGLVVTLQEGTHEQSQLDVLFTQARVHGDKKPWQPGTSLTMLKAFD